jgi:hypothetical protein
MPSRALREWSTTQRAKLDRLEAAARKGDRAIRQQLVDAYLLFLAGHFQHFCRELHDEAARFLAGQVQPRRAQSLVKELILDGRMLERGNARPGALRSDFARMGLEVLNALGQHDSVSSRRWRRLEQLNVWRNAIAAPGPAAQRAPRKHRGGHLPHPVMGTRLARRLCRAGARPRRHGQPPLDQSARQTSLVIELWHGERSGTA